MIQLTSLTDKKNIHHHFLLETPLPLEQCATSSIEKLKTSATVLMQDHYKLYKEYLNIPGWKEVLWAVTCNHQDINFKNLHLSYSTSYEAQAIRQGFNTKVKPLGLAGLLRTSDGFFVFGLRTGVAMGGYLCNAPAGHCAPEQPGANVMHAGFIEELETELGIHESEIETPYILGHQTDPDFGRSVNTVMYAQSTLTYQELQKRHKTARDAALILKEKGCNFNEVQDELKAQGFLNIDAHEHGAIVAIPDNQDSISAILETRQFEWNDNGEQRTSPIMDIARGTLLLLNKAKELNLI